MTFEDLRIIDPILRAVRAKGYDRPTPIQRQTFGPVAEGRDLIGCAQTGTGKTAAFALPLLQRLVTSVNHGGGGAHHGKKQRRAIRGLILSPTRELASQIADSFAHYGKHTGLRHTVIYGGVKQGSQVIALRDGVDILVATPGRLFDLIQQRHVRLDAVEIFVLDEADRMLDMGFIVDIRKIVKMIPAKRQTLMFSATMPREIRELAKSILTDPVHIEVAAESPAAETVHQSVAYVDQAAKDALLQSLLTGAGFERTLVFARTKRGCDRITRRLSKGGFDAAAIHSDRTQAQRQRALDAFKRGKVQVLVASDIAARGIDVSMVSHVVNFDLPADAETYVHRIGRTGRAGEKGKAITFVCPDQRRDFASIERTLKKQLIVLEHSVVAPPQSEADRDRAAPHAVHHAARPKHPASRSRQSGGGHGGGHAPSHSAGPRHANAGANAHANGGGKSKMRRRKRRGNGGPGKGVKASHAPRQHVPR